MIIIDFKPSPGFGAGVTGFSEAFTCFLWSSSFLSIKESFGSDFSTKTSSSDPDDEWKSLILPFRSTFAEFSKICSISKVLE